MEVSIFALLLAAVFCCALFGTIESRKDSSHSSSCKKVGAAAEINEAKWLAAKKKGVTFAMGSKMELTSKKVPSSPTEDTGRKSHACFTMTLRTMFGDLQIPLSCRYDNLKSESCYLKTHGTQINEFFKFYGDFVVTKTDNNKYWVQYGCLFGRSEMWVAAVVNGEELEPEEEEQILQHVVSLGLSRNEEDLKSDDDIIGMEGIKFAKCNKKGGVPDIVPGLETPV